MAANIFQSVMSRDSLCGGTTTSDIRLPTMAFRNRYWMILHSGGAWGGIKGTFCGDIVGGLIILEYAEAFYHRSISVEHKRPLYYWVLLFTVRQPPSHGTELSCWLRTILTLI